MNEPKVVALKGQHDVQRERCLDLLAQLYQACDQGVYTELVVIAAQPDGYYHLAKSGGPSRAKMAGYLMDATINVLGYKDDSDG